MTATLAFLDEPQLGAAVSLSQAEGWPHTIADWALMLRIGRGVALREGDDLRGTAVFIPYGEVDGAIAMVLVAKDARRHGLGRSLMTEVLAQAPERQLRLVSTASAVPLYQSLGFEPAGRVHQMEGWPDLGGLGPRNGVVLAMEGETPAILGLDKAAFGADRTRLLQALVADGEAMLLRDPFVTGFAIRRPFGDGVVIGPVVAPHLQAAKRLIAAHVARAPRAFVRIDTRDEALADWLSSCGLVEGAGGIAMIRPGAVLHNRVVGQGRGAQTFALAAHAFG
ncbi:acetyltransferase [Stappia sp. 22II-S9-Z10]|nr:acetyltransferase [Stappia sp. 22II-S9-Z10]